jgi:hypothetical protein
MKSNWIQPNHLIAFADQESKRSNIYTYKKVGWERTPNQNWSCKAESNKHSTTVREETNP